MKCSCSLNYDLCTSILALLALGIILPGARASEEEFVTWRSVRIESPPHPQTGTVVVDAALGDAGPTRFEIKAFGRAHTLTPADLAKLRGFPLDGLRITYEASYPQLGGTTVYVKLFRVQYSPKDKTTLKDEVIVSVSQGKGLAIIGPTRRD